MGLAGRIAPPCSIPPYDLAVFLDVDGTLVELAATPDAVVVPTQLLELLRQLIIRMDGAVALVSGRTLAVLDDLFHPLQLPAAGLHGFERRNALGSYSRRPLPDGPTLQRARAMLSEFVKRHPGLLLEDKRFALAVHFRAVPHLGQEVRRVVTGVARMLEGGLEVQPGQLVMELRPANANKASAIADFMYEPPFRGRHMVMIGDDLTDECAFRWVNAAGGFSIAVNVAHPTCAMARLESVAEVHRWLLQAAALN